MKKIIILFLLLTAFSFACGDDKYEPDFPYDPNYTVCGMVDPMENIDWLKEWTKSPVRVFARKYQGQDYLIFYDGHSSLLPYYSEVYGNAQGNIYDCQGNVLDENSDLYKELLRSFVEGEEGWICFYDFRAAFNRE